MVLICITHFFQSIPTTRRFLLALCLLLTTWWQHRAAHLASTDRIKSYSWTRLDCCNSSRGATSAKAVLASDLHPNIRERRQEPVEERQGAGDVGGGEEKMFHSRRLCGCLLRSTDCRDEPSCWWSVSTPGLQQIPNIQSSICLFKSLSSCKRMLRALRRPLISTC